MRNNVSSHVSVTIGYYLNRAFLKKKKKRVKVKNGFFFSFLMPDPFIIVII